VLCRQPDKETQIRIDTNRQFLGKLANIESIETLEANQSEPFSATALVDELEILVPMAGLIDVSAEKQRLQKEITKMEGDVNRVESKLNNEKFVNNAPADVVEKEKQKAEQLREAILKLQAQLQKLDML